MITFDREQKNALTEGEALRKQLRSAAEEACDVNKDIEYRHTMITGIAGTGKSYEVKRAIKNCGLTNYILEGQGSLFGLAQDIAVLKARNWNNPVVVMIDDCDFMFTDAESINAMKKILVKEDPAFVYKKNIHINSIPEGAKREAMELFMNDDEMGFRIPLDNFYFVICSNAHLPTNKTLKQLLEKSKGLMTSKIEKIDHLVAIRSRLNYKSVNTDKNGMWGSIAHVLLTDGGCPARTLEEKMMILDWMWNKWELMTETSVRTAEKMSEDIDRVGVENVKDRWTYNFID